MKGYSAIGLNNPKDRVNVAAALRACLCYNASFLAFTGKRYRHHTADTQNAVGKLPLFHVEDLSSVIPYDCVPVAVDLVEGATPLPEYKHPRRAFYIFGAEDATLGDKTLSFCRDVVYVPTNGCMNLAASVNVVLYDRLSKTQPR